MYQKLVSISLMEEDVDSILLILNIVHGFAQRMTGKLSYAQMDFQLLMYLKKISNIWWVLIRAIEDHIDI